jgi:hypothetical protein
MVLQNFSNFLYINYVQKMSQKLNVKTPVRYLCKIKITRKDGILFRSFRQIIDLYLIQEKIVFSISSKFAILLLYEYFNIIF